MKICLINNLYKPFARGGAERIVDIMAADFRSAGHEVFVISTKPRFGRKMVLSENSYYLPSLFYNLDKIPKIVRLLWHLIDMFDFVTAYNVKNILKKEKPDLVITHNLKGLSFLLPRAISSLKLDYLHYLHDIQLLHPSGLMLVGQEKMIDSLFARIYSSLNKYLFNNIPLVISPSHWLGQLYQSKGLFKKSRIEYILNPVMETSSDNQRADEKKEIFDFLCVAGHISKAKGVDFLLGAFIKNNCFGSRLTIVGDGQELIRIKNIASTNQNIRFIGRQTPEGIEKLMLTSDCLIVPSICYENSPTVIYEAANCGLPVVASSIGGIPELINFFGGYLFSPNDENDLADKIKEVLNNQAENVEIGQLSRNKIIEYFQKDYIDRLLNILEPSD